MARSCCRCIFTIISSAGSFTLLFLLFYNPKRPTCSIQDFYLPALNRSSVTSPGSNNATLYFDLKLDNTNALKGIYYDQLNLTFSYVGLNAVANYTAPGFYQGHNKKTHRREAVETSGVPWAAVLNGSARPVFRVDLVTTVRIKNILWTTKRRKLVVGAGVEVNDAGHKVKKEGIRLIKSSATGIGCELTPLLSLVVLLALIIFNPNVPIR